jgi:hypothetical protein
MNTQILAPMGKKLELWEGNYEFAKKPKNSGFLHKQILVKYRWLTRDDHWHESSKASLEYPLWQASHLSSAASSMDPRSEHMQLCQECNPLTWQQPSFYQDLYWWWLISTQKLSSFLLLVRRGAEHSDHHTKSFGKLDSHVT